MASTLSIRVLEVVNEERNTHGLRYGDYARYRKHCARKLHRLRQVLKLTNGKGKDFKKPPPTPRESVTDSHLILLLFEAERAWAYAQDLLNQNVKNQDSTTRRRALSRFKTAISWVKQLHDHSSWLHKLSPPRLSPTSYAEVVTYGLLLQGRFLRIKEEFNAAVRQLSVCHSLLDQLVASSSTSRDQALYAVFTDEIDPEIRYCAHEMGRSKAYDIAAIVADLAPKYMESIFPDGRALLAALEGSAASGSGKGQNLEPVIWEGKPVPIRTPELVDAFLRVQKAVRSLQIDRKVGDKQAPDPEPKHRHRTRRNQLAAFDGVLSALSDAENLARKMLDGQQGKGSSTPSGPGARDAHFVHAFISYQLLARRIQRDLIIANELLQPAPQSGLTRPGALTDIKLQVDSRVYPAVIKTLDTVLQSLDQMRTLSITDESPDISLALDLRISFTKGRRCRYLALAYAAAKGYPQAVALCQRGQLHLREANAIGDMVQSAAEIFFYPLEVKPSLDGLSSTLEEDALKCKKDWFAYNGGSTDSDPTTARKAKKPLFFDIAFNYIEPPMDRLRQRAGKEPAPKAAEPQTPTAWVAPSTTASGARSKVDVEDRDSDEDNESTKASPVVQSSGGLTSFLGSWWGRR